MLGAERQGNQKKFQVSVGYRESYANTLYNNSRPNHDLNRLLRPKEWLNSIDVTGTYQATDRLSLTLSVPVVINHISFLIPPGVDRRFGLPGHGIGDVAFVGRSYIFDPKKHPTANIGLGLGMKLPTGSAGPISTYPNVEGVFSRRPSTPNSIPPGDHGTGIIFETVAFKTFTGNHIFKGSNVLFTGNYLANPRDTNNVPSVLSTLGLATPGDINALTNTVGDAYALRAAFSMPSPGSGHVSSLKRVRWLASWRWEGIPKHDLFGGNRGFRQPGYVMSVAPGVSVRLYKQTRLTVEVPITINGRIDASPNVPQGEILRRFGFIAPVTVLARLTTTI